ncbi:MAG: MCE family protein, partial [Actinobacteria bacterium]|nr:MCE family protein [Actinomycetota bacterium]
MSRKSRAILAVGLLLILVAAVAVVVRPLWGVTNRTHMVAYFDNSNGIFVGDEVRILGVPVGEIDRIEPQPQRAKIS